MYTVDGRNPVPPGMYKTLSMMWTSWQVLLNWCSINNIMKTLDSWRFFVNEIGSKRLNQWIGMWNSSLFFQLWYQDSGARSRGDGWFITIRGIWNRWFDKFSSLTVSLTVFLASSKRKTSIFGHLHICLLLHFHIQSSSPRVGDLSKDRRMCMSNRQALWRHQKRRSPISNP